MIPRKNWVLLFCSIWCGLCLPLHARKSQHSNDHSNTKKKQSSRYVSMKGKRHPLTYYITHSGAYATLERAMRKAGFIGKHAEYNDLVANVAAHSNISRDSLQYITIFAPNDGAFADMPAYLRNQLFANVNKLRDVLRYHIVPGRYTSRDFENGVVQTLFNEHIRLEYQENGEMVIDGHARVIKNDIMASNGVLHTIDRVLIP